MGSLLVRDRVLSLQQMEAALHRQRIDGGELESVLLDMALVPENVLNAYRAAVYDLFPATREELRVDHSLGAPLSKKQWSVLRALPFSEEDDRLTIAVAEPMDPAIISRLERDTQKRVIQRIVTSLRLNIALSQWARFELSARDDRIARKLAMQNAGVTPFVKSPTSRLAADPVAKTGRRQRIRTLADTPTSADDPLKTLLRSAARDFDYVALFEVHDELACGIDAVGEGAETETLEGFAFPLDIPSAFSEAVLTRAATELGSESLDLLIKKDLKRSDSSSAIVIPLLQGQRRFLLYADRVEQAGTNEISALHRARTEFEESHIRGLPAGVGQPSMPEVDVPTILQQIPPHLNPAHILHIPHTAPPPPSLQEVRGAAQKAGGAREQDWLALVMRSKKDLNTQTIRALRDHAPACIEVLGEIFPGKLRSNSPASFATPVEELSSVCEALMILAPDYERAVGELLEAQLTDRNDLKRLCAIRLCDALRIEPFRTRVSLWAEVAREAESKNNDIQRVACRALRNRIMHAPLELPSLTSRYAALRVSNSSEAAFEATIAFVEEIRDPAALPALFTLLSDPTHRARAKQVATLVTGMDLGRDSSRWRMWLQQNIGVPRFFWLVDALDSPDIAMRAYACEELESYVGSSMGYSASAGRAQRTTAQEAFIAWHANPMLH